MRRSLFFIIWYCFFSVEAIAMEPKAKGAMEYLVSMPNPHTHYFEVQILLRNYDKDYVDLKMPVWTPGSYLVREYAKNVEGFTVLGGKAKQEIESFKINKNTWRINHKKEKEVMIRYAVYAFEGSVRMSFLDESHGFIMANTLFMYVEDLRNTSSVLKIKIPDQWKRISTSLTPLNGKGDTFYVPNYDILVDSPIEIGNHEVIEFAAAGVPHEVAMYGKAFYNEKQLKRDLTKIVKSATAIFEENPNEKYTFIIHNSDKRSGGLEHLSSTVLGVNRWTYSNTKSYNHFLALVAHEYFHLWMVKRLKPVELEVLDYDTEIYTDLLWVMEGITSYYEEKIMLDCDFYSGNQFLNNLLSGMSKIRNAPGSREQSVAESSFDTWIKYYRKNENSNNNQVSYYNKGMILGALLDLQIINGSLGERSLDDVINQLYYQYYKKKGKGVTSDDLQKAAEKASGINLNSFFDDYVFGTKDLDYEKYLHFAGIGLVETNNTINSKSIGIHYKQTSKGLVISSVMRGGAAYENGLNVGDELISINGLRVNSANINAIINQLKVGDRVATILNRNGLIIEKDLDIRKDEIVSFAYEYLGNKTKRQEKVYKVWMGK